MQATISNTQTDRITASNLKLGQVAAHNGQIARLAARNSQIFRLASCRLVANPKLVDLQLADAQLAGSHFRITRLF